MSEIKLIIFYEYFLLFEPLVYKKWDHGYYSCTSQITTFTQTYILLLLYGYTVYHDKKDKLMMCQILKNGGKVGVKQIFIVVIILQYSTRESHLNISQFVLELSHVIGVIIC